MERVRLRKDVLRNLGTSGGLVGGHLSAALGTRAARAIRSHHLARNAAAVGSLADGRQDGANGINNALAGVRIGKVHSSLNNVVGKGITQHFLQLVAIQDLINHFTANGVIRSAQALLNHIGAELLLGQRRDVTGKGLAQRSGETRIGKIQDVLNNIVSKGVLDKSVRVRGDPSDQLSLLGTRGMINAALQNTASMAVGADNDTMSTNSLVDELGLLGVQAVQALLNDVVAIQVLDQIHDMVLQRIDNSLGLLGSGDELDHLLESAGTMLVQRDLNKLGSSVVNEGGALLVVGVLKKLLAQVVAERIYIDEKKTN